MKDVLLNRNQHGMQQGDVYIEQQIVSFALEKKRNRHFLTVLVQLNIELKTLTNQNNEIIHEINRCNNDLQKYVEKLQVLDNMTQLATQSLEVYFQTVKLIVFKKNFLFS